jgi:hypothetical protein
MPEQQLACSRQVRPGARQVAASREPDRAERGPGGAPDEVPQ